MPRMPFTVPQRKTSKTRKHKLQHLPALPFDPSVIIRVHGPDALKQRGDSYIYQNKVFRKGMLILDMQSTHAVRPIPLPSLNDIKPFIDAGFVDATTALSMTSHEVLSSIRPGDYIQLIAGEQAGCRAMVVTCDDDIASVDIEPFDSDLNPVYTPSFPVDVPLHYMQRIIRVGDNVRVKENAGDHAGSSGCVVAVLDGGRHLSFIEDKTRNTVSVFL